MIYLDDAELHRLTGYKRPADQRRKLDELTRWYSGEEMITDDERIRNYWASKMLDQLTHEGPLIRLMRQNMKRPTRWERFTWRVLHYRNRVRDAWLVLIGRKEACDPCEF